MAYRPTLGGPLTEVETLCETNTPASAHNVSTRPQIETNETLLAPVRPRISLKNAHCSHVMARDCQYFATVDSVNSLLPDGIGYDDEATADVDASGANIALGALSAPMQKRCVHRNAANIHANFTVGAVAALVFLAGNVDCAPPYVRNAKCEWVWRLALEPRLLATRDLEGNVSFLATTTKQAAGP